MKLENYPRGYDSAVDGPAPTVWYGEDAPNGDSRPYSPTPIGSVYVQTGDSPNVWHKATDEAHDTDWVIGMGVAVVRANYADFTDGGAAVGTLASGVTIPAGAWVLRTVVTGVTGFTGDTSAALTIGDGTDADRYNNATVDVFTTVVALDGGAPSGTQVHTTAKDITLTITSATDWGAVEAGDLTVKVFYLM
jgi:hypothetical protein